MHKLYQLEAGMTATASRDKCRQIDLMQRLKDGNEPAVTPSRLKGPFDLFEGRINIDRLSCND
jgi:hypothetical protein